MCRTELNWDWDALGKAVVEGCFGVWVVSYDGDSVQHIACETNRVVRPT